MARRYTPKKANGPKAFGKRRDIHAEITNKIVEELEAGTVPWLKPWKSNAAFEGMPYNLVSKRSYSGINVLVLWAEALDRGYASSAWLTFNQAKQKGGHIRKGEHGTQITFWKKLRITDQETEEDKEIMMLKTFTVFNVEQCEGIEYKAPVKPEVTEAHQLNEAYMAQVERLETSEGLKLNHGGDRACYIPALDKVMMPELALFRDAAHYMATLAHELVHWSGAKKRLDRLDMTSKGTSSYAFEELVAEMGAAFTCAEYGIKGDLRHASYINSWIKLLKEDKKALFRAASRASKAVAYLYPTEEEAMADALAGASEERRMASTSLAVNVSQIMADTLADASNTAA